MVSFANKPLILNGVVLNVVMLSVVAPFHVLQNGLAYQRRLSNCSKISERDKHSSFPHYGVITANRSFIAQALFYLEQVSE
jgi:hypothetical protein